MDPISAVIGAVIGAFGTLIGVILIQWFQRRRLVEPLVPLTARVLVINFDPIVDAQGTRLTTKMGWHNVDDLISGFIADMEEVSYGLVKYQYDSANRIDVN